MSKIRLLLLILLGLYNVCAPSTNTSAETTSAMVVSNASATPNRTVVTKNTTIDPLKECLFNSVTRQEGIASCFRYKSRGNCRKLIRVMRCYIKRVKELCGVKNEMDVKEEFYQHTDQMMRNISLSARLHGNCTKEFENKYLEYICYFCKADAPKYSRDGDEEYSPEIHGMKDGCRTISYECIPPDPALISHLTVNGVLRPSTANQTLFLSVMCTRDGGDRWIDVDSNLTITDVTCKPIGKALAPISYGCGTCNTTSLRLIAPSTDVTTDFRRTDGCTTMQMQCLPPETMFRAELSIDGKTTLGKPGDNLIANLTCGANPKPNWYINGTNTMVKKGIWCDSMKEWTGQPVRGCKNCNANGTEINFSGDEVKTKLVNDPKYKCMRLKVTCKPPASTSVSWKSNLMINHDFGNPSLKFGEPAMVLPHCYNKEWWYSGVLVREIKCKAMSQANSTDHD